MARPRTYKVSLSEEEYSTLKKISRCKKTSKIRKLRCQILLDLDDAHGKYLTHAQCVKSNGTCPMTVHYTVKKFCTEGLDAALSIKRSAKSDVSTLKVDGKAEAKLIQLACSEVPKGHSRWTLKLLQEKSKVILETPVSESTICRVLKKTNCVRTSATIGAYRQKKTQNS